MNHTAGPRRADRWQRLSGGAAAWLATGVDLVLPRPCPGCGGPEPWCAGCAKTLAGRARLVRLSDEVLDAARTRVPPVRALARYTGPVRAAILAGKDGGRRDLPPRLGTELGRALVQLRRLEPVEALWLVPAPSRRSAARGRGGDPVTAMANAAAGHLAARGVPVGVAPCLVTAAGAVDSVGLGTAARLANLAGRVRFRSSGSPPPGAGVVLVDDVVTSGSTALAATAALAERGIRVQAVLAVATAASWARGTR